MKDPAISNPNSTPALPQIATVIPELTNLTSILLPETPADNHRPIFSEVPQSGHEQLALPPLLVELPTLTQALPPHFNQTVAGGLYVEPSQPEQHTLPPLNHLRKGEEYDAETFQKSHNTTSHFKRCIDGYFFNHNEQALKELQNIITVTDRGMTLLSAEIDRARYGTQILTAP